MNNKKYQKEAGKTAIYPGRGELKKGNMTPLSYLALGLNGEAGEVAEKVKKLIRDKNSVIDAEFKELMVKEIGDVFWYCSNLCDELEISIDEVMQGNIEKLASRKQRNVIVGSGDER